jgi:hypothetical protein
MAERWRLGVDLVGSIHGLASPKRPTGTKVKVKALVTERRKNRRHQFMRLIYCRRFLMVTV